MQLFRARHAPPRKLQNHVVAVETRNRRGLIGIDRLLGCQVAQPVDGGAIRKEAAQRVLGTGVGVEIAHEDCRVAVFRLREWRSTGP